MLTYKIENRKGFEVIHNSEAWRMAVHSYEKDVNSLGAFQNFGVHETSEEAFVLLKGQAWLVAAKEGQTEEDYQIFPLCEMELSLVEQGEYHAIILKEDSCVLIMENLDMSQSRNIPICAAVKKAVCELVGTL